ncbi:hypothetical protein T01_1760 [Trichinella spiralis]|uniref:Uncharacterized protein n=1 Tax=Trichinella spiralis TaxID=6334 RepID=A0A0V1B2T0_TRISP|nr:hypothetical protein T01_16278 [Trichinella spiralis]KRY31233.1 hypothetical protein T01_1760 [Trichinella spiralis]
MVVVLLCQINQAKVVLKFKQLKAIQLTKDPGVGCGIILRAVAFLQELRKFYTQVNVDNNFNNYP